MIFFLFGKKKKQHGEFPSELEVPPPPGEVFEFPSLKMEEKLSRPLKEDMPMKNELPPLEEYEESIMDEEKKELKGIDEHAGITKPIYLKLGAFKAITDKINQVNAHLNESNDLLKSINDFKEDEDKELRRFRSITEEINRKLIYADKILFEGR